MNQSKNVIPCVQDGCPGDMIEKGETGRTVTYSDTEGMSWCKREVIYQCPDCKTIHITT